MSSRAIFQPATRGTRIRVFLDFELGLDHPDVTLSWTTAPTPTRKDPPRGWRLLPADVKELVRRVLGIYNLGTINLRGDGFDFSVSAWAHVLRVTDEVVEILKEVFPDDDWAVDMSAMSSKPQIRDRMRDNEQTGESRTTRPRW